MDRPCVECESQVTPPSRICDDCLGEQMMARVRKYERVAREHQDGAFNPNFRFLAFDARKEMREMGVSP